MRVPQSRNGLRRFLLRCSAGSVHESRGSGGALSAGVQLARSVVLECLLKSRLQCAWKSHCLRWASPWPVPQYWLTEHVCSRAGVSLTSAGILCLCWAVQGHCCSNPLKDACVLFVQSLSVGWFHPLGKVPLLIGVQEQNLPIVNLLFLALCVCLRRGVMEKASGTALSLKGSSWSCGSKGWCSTSPRWTSKGETHIYLMSHRPLFVCN